MNDKKTATPNTRKVPIDAILKNGNSGNHSSTKRGRGRPPGSKDKTPRVLPNGTRSSEQAGSSRKLLTGSHGGVFGSSDGSFRTDEGSSSANQGVVSAPSVTPIYDTTEEAKAAIRSPFELAASFTGVKELALTTPEIDAVMPSWKTVYDKRIAPRLGENADIVMFAMVMGGIAANKWRVLREAQERAEKLEKAKKENSESTQSAHSPPTIATDLITQ